MAISLRFATSNFLGTLGAAAADFGAVAGRVLPVDGLILSRGYKRDFDASKGANRRSAWTRLPAWKHPTFNLQHPAPKPLACDSFDVRCWMLNVRCAPLQGARQKFTKHWSKERNQQHII